MPRIAHRCLGKNKATATRTKWAGLTASAKLLCALLSQRSEVALCDCSDVAATFGLQMNYFVSFKGRDKLSGNSRPVDDMIPSRLGAASGRYEVQLEHPVAPSGSTGSPILRGPLEVAEDASQSQFFHCSLPASRLNPSGNRSRNSDRSQSVRSMVRRRRAHSRSVGSAMWPSFADRSQTQPPEQ